MIKTNPKLIVSPSTKEDAFICKLIPDSKRDNATKPRPHFKNQFIFLITEFLTNKLRDCLNLDVRCLDVRWIDEIFKIMKISELSNHLIYPSKYLKSNHLNKNINMKFKQSLNHNLH